LSLLSKETEKDIQRQKAVMNVIQTSAYINLITGLSVHQLLVE